MGKAKRKISDDTELSLEEKKQLLIMNLADGKLEGKEKKSVQKLVSQDSQARKLYQIYLKTSLFNGVLEEVNNSKIPQNLKEKLDKLSKFNVVEKNQDLEDSNFKKKTDGDPKVLAIGIGGAGGNIINSMKLSGVEGVEFINFNTDSQQLKNSKVDKTLLLGPLCTKGLGADADPELGKKAAQEVSGKIEKVIKNFDIIFLVAGMGGGTGGGAAPVVAKIAKKYGILNFGLVTKPFEMEGEKKRIRAEYSINNLKKHLDNLLVIPNQKLFHIIKPETNFVDSLNFIDEIFVEFLNFITFTKTPSFNFELEIGNIFASKGNFFIGTGLGKGEDRAIKATRQAILNPLLENDSIKGAKEVLVKISGSNDIVLHEIDLAIMEVKNNLDEDANVYWCFENNKGSEDEFKISILTNDRRYAGKASRQKISFSSFLNRANYIISNWFSASFFPKLATVCLFFFIVGQISFENIFSEKDNKFRSGVETFGNNEIFKYLDITIKGDKIVNFGGYLKNGEEFKILITAKEKGYLKINFPMDRIEFSSNVNKNEKIIFPKNELTFKASKPSIFFEIEFKTTKKLYNNEFKFLVE